MTNVILYQKLLNRVELRIQPYLKTYFTILIYLELKLTKYFCEGLNRPFLDVLENVQNK